MNTQDRNMRRQDAAQQFADAGDEATREGFSLIAHGNSGYELKRGNRTVAWFFPDHSEKSLKVWMRAQMALEMEASR